MEKSLPLHSSNKHHVTQKENSRTETSTLDGKNDVGSSIQQFSKSTSKSAELSALLVGTPKVRLVTKRHGKRKKRHNTGNTSKRLRLLASKANATTEKSDVLPSTGPTDDDHTVLSVFSTETARGTNAMLVNKSEGKTQKSSESDLKQNQNADLMNINQITQIKVSENTNTERSLRCRSRKPTKELQKLCESNTGPTEKPRRCKKKFETSHGNTVAQSSKSLENVETTVTNTRTKSEEKSSKICSSDAGSLKVINNAKLKSRGNTSIKPYNTFVYTGRKLVNKQWLRVTVMKLRNLYLISKTKHYRALAKRTKTNMKKERYEANKSLKVKMRHTMKTKRDLKRRLRRNSCKENKTSVNMHISADETKNNSGSKISLDNKISKDIQAKESNRTENLCSNTNADSSTNDIHVDLETKISTSESDKKSNDDSLQTAGRQYNEKCNNLKRIIDVVKNNTSPKTKDISAKTEIITGRRQNEHDPVPSVTETDSKTESKRGLSENVALLKPGLDVVMNNKYNYFNNKLNSPNVDTLVLGSDVKGVSEVSANGGQDDANHGIKNMAFEFSEEEEDDEIELVLRISESEDEQNQTEINADYDFFNNKRSCQPNRKTKLDSEEVDICKKSKLIEEHMQIKKENRNKNEEKGSTNKPCLNSEDITQASENGVKTMINSANKSNHRNNLFVPVAGGKKSVCEIKLPMKESNKLTTSNILANSNRNGSSQNQRIIEMKKSTFEKDSHQLKVQNNLCTFGFNGNNSTITPKYKNISNSSTESIPSEDSIVNAPIKCEVKSDIPKELSQISCKVSGIDGKKPKSTEGKLCTKIISPKELLLPFTLSVAKNDMKQTSDNVDVSLKPSLEILPLNPVETDSSSNKGYASHTSPSDYTKLIPKKPGRDLRKPPPPIPIVRISKIDELLSEIAQSSIKMEVKEAQTKSSEMKVHIDNNSGANDVPDKRIKSEVLDLSKKSRSRHTNSSLIFPNQVNMIKNPHVSSEHKFSYPRSASTLSPPINVKSSPSTPKTSPTLSDGSFDGGYNIHANDNSPIVSEISPVRNSNISKALDNARSSALINTLSSAAVSKDYHLHSAIAVLNRERMCGASVNVRPCDFPSSQRIVPNKMNEKVFKSCSMSEKNPKLERSKSTGSLHMNHPQACPDSFPKFYPDPRSPILSPTQTAFRESPILARHITGRLGKTEQPKDSNCYKGSFQRNGKTKVESCEYFASDTCVAKSPLVLNVGRLAPPMKKHVHNPYTGSATPKSNRKYQNINTFVPNSVDSYENLEESPRCVPNKKLKFHDKSPPAESFPQTKLPYVGYSAISPSRSEMLKSQTVPSIAPVRRLQLENSVPRQEMEVKKLNHSSNYNHLKSMMNKQQNQTIRHIPNPSALTFRQQRCNSNVNPDANSGNPIEQNIQKKKQNVVTEICEVEEDQDNKNVIPTDDSNILGKKTLVEGSDLYGISKSSDSKNVITHSRPETPNSVNYALGNNDIKYGTVSASFPEGFQTVRNRNNYGRSKTPTPELSYGERNKYLYNRRSKTPTPELTTLEKNNNDANKSLNPFVLLPIISDVRSLAAGDFNNSEKPFKSKRRNSAVMEN